nr:immunoglobulin heavy chain junction region [Macaca mulatta]MOX58926.1 immunoglobulin heavy chain junction region [Macaca mulatta]MOX59815.1 immunoglobulin heavy chain junction region [Macaca mulatta]MOX60203.1 immunoglobulin heavy chain junction region [Macaca mulatta]MOX60722.1 immunoglobulin heavy chain junction region [Macaca mulatta]
CVRDVRGGGFDYW